MTSQLAKIVPLLGSNQPGEVAAAAAAIGRVLASSGRDWHWLARAAVGTPQPVPAASADQLRVARLTAECVGLRGQLDGARRSMEAMRSEAATLRRRVSELEDAARRAAAQVRAERPRVHVTPPQGSATVRQWQFRVARMLAEGAGATFILTDRDREFLTSVRDTCLAAGRGPSVPQTTRLAALWERYRMAAETRRRRGSRSWSEVLEDEVPF